MSDKDFKARSLQVMDVDLRITMQGGTVKIELPLPSTGNPNEMPLAAIDQQKANKYLTSAENRLTDYLASQGVGNFRVDKLTGSGKGESNVGVVKLELQSGAEANRIFSDRNFIFSLQQGFDRDRSVEHMKAAASWTEGIGGNGGARVPYSDPQKKDAKEVVVKVEDTVAFKFYQDNFAKVPGYLGNEKKFQESNDLGNLMNLRDSLRGRRSSIEGDDSPALIASNERTAPASSTQTNSVNADALSVSKPNDTINKNDIYKNDGAPFQFDRQNLQAAATTTPSPTLVEGNEAINKLFKQAMSGIENTSVPNKLDAAALAVQTISQAPGFNQDKDISVMQGSKGLIVSQGEGPAGMNLLVPQANKGDLEKVSEQMTMSQPQQNMQLAPVSDQYLAKQQSAARTM